MVGIVIVSHSEKLAEGVKDLCRMMTKDVPIEACGGLMDGSFGTDFEKIMAGVNKVHSEEGTLLLMDMGSAVMTAEMVLEMAGYDNVALVDAPVAEGAVAAAVTSAGGGSLEEVKAEAESAWEMRKL